MRTWITLTALATLAMSELSHGQTGPWKQSEFTETYMRSLTRSQCVAKLLTTYEKVCGDDYECLKTIAGASGDCYAWSKDDVGPMCEYLPTQVEPGCQSNRLTPLQCKVLRTLGQGFCDGTVPETDEEIELSAKEIFQRVAPSTVVVVGLNPNLDALIFPRNRGHAAKQLCSSPRTRPANGSRAWSEDAAGYRTLRPIRKYPGVPHLA